MMNLNKQNIWYVCNIDVIDFKCFSINFIFIQIKGGMRASVSICLRLHQNPTGVIWHIIQRYD